jgi:hypothetical protein
LLSVAEENYLAALSDSVVAKSVKGRWVMKALVRVILAVGILAAWSKGDFVVVWMLALIELAMMKTFLLALVLAGLVGLAGKGLHSRADYAVTVVFTAVAVYLHVARHRGWLLRRPWREV